MGGWKLEVAKMAIYMAFPVACFHLFNQPEYFEDWVTKIKREIYPPENKAHWALFEEAKRRMQEQQDAQLLQALEERDNKI